MRLTSVIRQITAILRGIMLLNGVLCAICTIFPKRFLHLFLHQPIQLLGSFLLIPGYQIIMFKGITLSWKPFLDNLLEFALLSYPHAGRKCELSHPKTLVFEKKYCFLSVCSFLCPLCIGGERAASSSRCPSGRTAAHNDMPLTQKRRQHGAVLLRAGPVDLLRRQGWEFPRNGGFSLFPRHEQRRLNDCEATGQGHIQAVTGPVKFLAGFAHLQGVEQ